MKMPRDSQPYVRGEEGGKKEPAMYVDPGSELRIRESVWELKLYVYPSAGRFQKRWAKLRNGMGGEKIR